MTTVRSLYDGRTRTKPGCSFGGGVKYNKVTVPLTVKLLLKK